MSSRPHHAHHSRRATRIPSTRWTRRGDCIRHRRTAPARHRPPPPSHRLRTPRARALAELGRARRALQPRHVGLPQATVRALRALRRARERARRRDDASHDDNRIYEQKDARENARNATATGRTKQHKQYDLRAAAANTPSRRRTTRQRQDQNLEIGLGAQWRARGVGYGAEPAHRYFRDSARGVSSYTLPSEPR